MSYVWDSFDMLRNLQFLIIGNFFAGVANDTQIRRVGFFNISDNCKPFCLRTRPLLSN